MYIFSIAKFVKNSIVFSHFLQKIAQGRKTGLDLKNRYAIGKLEVLGLKLYLIRHGETDWNKEFKIQGSSDIELNEYGRELAFITREGLRHIPFDIAYTSPLKRAKETAEIILGGRNIPLYEDKRVQEACFGSFEGATLKELRERQDPFLKFFDAPEEFKKLKDVRHTKR